jgi:hypothetical protein
MPMATPNHHFSRPAEVRQDDEIARAQVFSIDRRYNALDIRTSSLNGGHVVTVGEGADQLDNAITMAEADILGGRYPFARAGLVRRALRPASDGAGRARFR